MTLVLKVTWRDHPQSDSVCYFFRNPDNIEPFFSNFNPIGEWRIEETDEGNPEIFVFVG